MTRKSKKAKEPLLVGVSKWFPALTSLEVSVLAWHLGLFSWIGLHGFWWTLLGFDAFWGLISTTLWVALGREIRTDEAARALAKRREQVESFRASVGA